MFDYNNKTVLITGAGSGIGKAIALLFGRQGATVVAADLSAAAAETTAKEISAAGGHAQPLACDVSDQAAVKAAYEKLPAIDVLVNSAGVSHIGRLGNTTEADFDRLFRVNVKGVYNSMLAALPRMQEQKRGVILNIASIAGHVGLADRFAYSMTKGAVYAMTLSVAKDYLADGIRCNSVSPARVHTPFVDDFIAKNYPGREAEMFGKLSASQPIGRMAQPQEVAGLVLYLCSDEASFITGTDYPIDGGFITLNT